MSEVMTMEELARRFPGAASAYRRARDSAGRPDAAAERIRALTRNIVTQDPVQPDPGDVDTEHQDGQDGQGDRLETLLAAVGEEDSDTRWR